MRRLSMRTEADRQARSVTALLTFRRGRITRERRLGSHEGRTGARSALGVAERYARGLRRRAVWVCNHCDFRQPASAEVNRGNVWTQVHVADKFRPGQVPGAFPSPCAPRSPRRPVPFLVRKVEPFENLRDLRDALVPLPRGNGGDMDEALEDALARYREIVDD